MNRRTFIRTVIGSAFTAATVPALVWGRNYPLSWTEADPRDVKDLILWAPYQPFMPDDSNPVLEDPSDGTETGVLKAEDILKGQPLTLKYWHGHDGMDHMFTITAADLNSLKSGHPVVLYERTTVVQDHYHMTVIDPNKPA